MDSYHLVHVRNRLDNVFSFAPDPIKTVGAFMMDASGLGLACLPRQYEQAAADIQDAEDRQIKDLLNKYPTYF